VIFLVFSAEGSISIEVELVDIQGKRASFDPSADQVRQIEGEAMHAPALPIPPHAII